MLMRENEAPDDTKSVIYSTTEVTEGEEQPIRGDLVSSANIFLEETHRADRDVRPALEYDLTVGPGDRRFLGKNHCESNRVVPEVD